MIYLAIFSISSEIPLLFWTDSTARVARRSDPFERDTLHWSKLKYPLAAGLIIVGLIILVESPKSIIYGLGVGVPLQSVPVLYTILGLAQYLVLALTAVAVILVGAIRSRDRALKNHLKWFGLFPATIFSTLFEIAVFNYFFSGTVPNSAGNLIGLALIYIILGFGGYCLYKSARTLAPTTRQLERKKTTTTTTGASKN